MKPMGVPKFLDPVVFHSSSTAIELRGREIKSGEQLGLIRDSFSKKHF